MIFYSINELKEYLTRCGNPRAVVALGVFDGVHLGHQAILADMLELAGKTGAAPVALFFTPHPRELLSPPGPRHLTTDSYKCRLLRFYGAEYVLAMPFSMELAAMSPSSFLENYFGSGGLDAAGFCVGENWRFGSGNKGNAGFLADWAREHGKSASIVPSVNYEGEPISSTRLRSLVEAGGLDKAAAMLGRRFAVSGTVVHGNAIGRKLDCATANIVDPGHVLPPCGVYSAEARWDGRGARGIVYVGTAPTVRKDASEPWVELHLFDCNEDLYGKELEVQFLKFIRPDRKFASQEELAQQIRQDIEAARKA